MAAAAASACLSSVSGTDPPALGLRFRFLPVENIAILSPLFKLPRPGAQAPPARVVVRVTRGGRAARAGRLLRTAAGAGAAAARRRWRRHPARTSGPGRGGCGRALFEVIFVLYFLYLLKISKMRDADVNPFALNEDLTTSNENAAARSFRPRSKNSSDQIARLNGQKRREESDDLVSSRFSVLESRINKLETRAKEGIDVLNKLEARLYTLERSLVSRQMQ